MSGVLILHDGADPSAQALERELHKRSVLVRCLDLGALPESGELALEDDTLWLQGRRLERFALAVNRSHLTRFAPPAPRALMQRSFRTWYGRYLAEQERQAFLVSVVSALEAGGTRLVNPLAASDLAWMRPLVLDRLRQAGIPCAAPESMSPQEPSVRPLRREGEELLRFYVLGGRVLAWGALRPGPDATYEARASAPADAEELAVKATELLGVDLAAVDLLARDSGPLFW